MVTFAVYIFTFPHVAGIHVYKGSSNYFAGSFDPFLVTLNALCNNPFLFMKTHFLMFSSVF